VDEVLVQIAVVWASVEVGTVVDVGIVSPRS